MIVALHGAVCGDVADGAEVNNAAFLPKGRMAFLRLAKTLGKSQLAVVIK